mgnify:CR=1 FL=1
MKLKLIAVIALALSFFSCETNPEPIEYGVDGCHFCRMTIVDKVHAAEIVTKKGKVYKFDATECMIHYLNDIDTTTVALFLSNCYNAPRVLIDATQASFLISKEIPSPMGANLTAFKNEDSASRTQIIKGGDVYSWNELLDHLNNN